MEEKIKKWQADLGRAIETKKELNAIYDARIRELKQKIADGQEELMKEQDRKVASMIRDTYGELTPQAMENLGELLKIAEQPEEAK